MAENSPRCLINRALPLPKSTSRILSNTPQQKLCELKCVTFDGDPRQRFGLCEPLLLDRTFPASQRIWTKKLSSVSSLFIFQVFHVADGGLHVFPRLVVEGQRAGVVVGAVSQSPVGSAVSKGTGFAVGRETVHLFFFVQEGEFHFNFNCMTQ